MFSVGNFWNDDIHAYDGNIMFSSAKNKKNPENMLSVIF